MFSGERKPLDDSATVTFSSFKIAFTVSIPFNVVSKDFWQSDVTVQTCVTIIFNGVFLSLNYFRKVLTWAPILPFSNCLKMDDRLLESFLLFLTNSSMLDDI